MFYDDMDTTAPEYCNLLLNPCLQSDNAMLAEQAATKVAYATIKKFVVNGREITDVLLPSKTWLPQRKNYRRGAIAKRMVCSPR